MEKVIVFTEQELKTLYQIVDNALLIDEETWHHKVQTIKNKLDDVEQRLLLSDALCEDINKGVTIFDDDNFLTNDIYFRNYVNQETGEKWSETYYRYAVEKFNEE